MRRIICLLCPLLFVVHNTVYASAPAGFESFFQFVPKVVTLRDPNGRYSSVTIEANQNQIRLTQDSGHTDHLRTILLSANISHVAVDAIMADLAQQVDISFEQCNKLNITECTPLTASFQFLFDYDKNLLLLFVHPSLMDGVTEGSSELNYYHPHNPDPAIINHLSLYADKFTGQESNFRMSDEIYAGLGYGYLHADMQYQSNDNQFDLYQLAYHLDVKNYHFRAGQFRGFSSLNSTDFLRQISSLNGTRERILEFGYSNNLLIGKQNQSKIVNYFAPAAGRLVVRDITNDRFLINRNTEQGQRDFSYSELPYGVYEVVVEVKNGDQVLYNQNHLIHNRLSDDLALGEHDLALSVGTLEGRTSWASDGYGEEIAFSRGLFSRKLHPSTLFGAGLMLSEHGDIGTMGLSIYTPWNFNLDTVFSYADSSESYFNTALNVANFGLSYQKLWGSDQDNLASTLFGYGDYERWYANYGTNLGNVGFLRVTGSYAYNQSQTTGVEYETLTLSSGLSSQLNTRTRLDLDLGYQTQNFSSGFDTDNLYATVALSISIGASKDLTWTSQFQFNDEPVAMVRNSMSAHRLVSDDEVSLSGYVSHSVRPEQGEHYTNGSLSTQYDNGLVAANGYFTGDSNQRAGASIGFGTSTVIANREVYHSSSKANSYAVVDMTSHSSQINSHTGLKGHLMIEQQDGLYQREILYHSDRAIPLEPYSKYQLDLDTDIADLYNTGERYTTGYSFPGGVVKIDVDVGVAKRVVVGFKDVFDQPISQLTCEGAGCIDVNEITTGVFNITLVDELPHTLKTPELICNLTLEPNAKVNYGNHYCLPSLSLGQRKLVSNEKGNSQIIQYLGDFYPDSGIEKKLENIRDNNILVYLLNKHDHLSVYITYHDQSLISMQQKEVIDSLLRFASNNRPVDVGKK